MNKLSFLANIKHFFGKIILFLILIALGQGLFFCQKDIPAYKKRQKKFKIKPGKPLPCPCDHQP